MDWWLFRGTILTLMWLGEEPAHDLRFATTDFCATFFVSDGWGHLAFSETRNERWI